MFDQAVADVFGDMLRRSIPQYDVMRAAVLEVGAAFVQPGTAIVDLGCSRGDALAPFVERFGDRNYFVGAETSAPMLGHARARFANAGCVDVVECDLRNGYPVQAHGASCTLAVLTLQFVPIEHRARILREAFHATVPGGALVLVEKVLGATADLQALFVERYHDMKRAHGYSQDAIDRKALSLQGVLVPVTARWNEEALATAGFRQVECFWRWMNFAGWVAVRE